MSALPSPSTPPQSPAWTSDIIKKVSGDFARRQMWIKVFTGLGAIGCLFDLVSFNLIGLAFSGALLVAAISAWKASDLFTLAHRTGRGPELTEALEQLEKYFRVSTITILVAAGLIAIGLVLALLLVVVVTILGGAA